MLIIFQLNKEVINRKKKKKNAQVLEPGAGGKGLGNLPTQVQLFPQYAKGTERAQTLHKFLL